MRMSLVVPLLALGLGCMVFVWADDEKPADKKKEEPKPAAEVKDPSPKAEGERADPPPRNPDRVREGDRPRRPGENPEPNNRNPNQPGFRRDGDQPRNPGEEGFRPPLRRDGERPDNRPDFRPQYGEDGRPSQPRRPDAGPGPVGPPDGVFNELDPEMQELTRKDFELERQTIELARKVRETSGDQKQQAMMTLVKTVEEHFQARQARRELQIKRLAEELERLKDQVKARNEGKADIIRRRVMELAGEEGAIGF